MRQLVLSHVIAPRLCHVDIPVCCLHQDHGIGLFEAKLVPSRIQFSNVGTKPEPGPHFMRSSSVAMGHAHMRQLPQESCDNLTSIAPLSCCNHFPREQAANALNLLRSLNQILKVACCL